MIIVDAQRRASLEEVAHHEWLLQGAADDPIHSVQQQLPSIINTTELPESEVELLLLRMEEGGYGSTVDILK